MREPPVRADMRVTLGGEFRINDGTFSNLMAACRLTAMPNYNL